MTTELGCAIKPGASPPPRRFGPITTAMVVRYAGAAGDFNPIHYDSQFAMNAGFHGVFSQGMHQAALLATFATDWLGPENVRRYRVRFRAQVWPGDVLTCTGVVTAITAMVDHDLASVDLACARQTGEIAIDGSAEFVASVRVEPA